MTAVVLVGDFPSTGILQATVAQRVSTGGPDDGGPPAFIDQMAHAIRQRGAVLVLYPAWKKTGAQRLVRLARSAMLTDRIAGLALDVPPLALSLIADQLAFASSYARPGVLASLAQRLCENVQAGAWVNSVARMEHIKTGLGAHVSSYLPGAGFAVSTTPHAAVHRISSAKPVVEQMFRPADPVLMLYGDVNGDLDWLQNRLRPTLGAASVTAVAPQPLSAEYWGTKKYTEFVAFSGHPQALQSLLAGSLYAPCGWCGEPTALPECPFCFMVQTAHAAAAPQGPSQPPSQSPPPVQPQPGPPAQPQPQPQPRPPAFRQSAPQPVQPPAPQPVQPPAAQPPTTPPTTPPSPVQPDHVEAPPTRPQVPHRQGRPQPAPPPGPHPPRPQSSQPRDPRAASPAQAAGDPPAPARREPVLAAPVGPHLGARGHDAPESGVDTLEEADRTRVQMPPGSWGSAAAPGDHRTGGTENPTGKTETTEPADDEARPSKHTTSIETLLNDSQPPRSAASDPPPERMPTPDDEWRTGTVAFRPQPRR
ncbi:hypothetical protein LUW74_26135 [Actinomadura madurae]|uniref:hypothetical protein n=1 Tax=Actinomadura madurae TaxID=1993 RepID=UPI0020268154|nr:hypothetical protein [Actinomadura madurae]URN06460.1 hypothetical protein LUW74_26135 [Actinomadura madurae]